MVARLGVDPSPLDRLSAYLQKITGALAAASTEQQVIEIVLTPTVEALGAVAGIVLLVDATDQQIKIAGSQGYEIGARTVWQEGSVQDHVLVADIIRMKEAMYFEYAGALRAAYPHLESRTGALTATANAALPMFLDDRPFGVIVLDFTEPHHFTEEEQRFLTILASQCAIAMGRAEIYQTLEVRVEERTRQLEEERAAQAAFVAFTEAVGSEADLPALAREAIKVLLGRFPGASAIYYEEEDTLWKGRVWSDNLRPELVAMISAGIPSETPIFAQVVQTRQAVFTDGWDSQWEHMASTGDYANYPLVIGGEMRSLLSIGLQETHSWSEADRAMFRAVGRSLNLALERTETARQVMLQNTELHARTRALEAIASLASDLTPGGDRYTLIRRAQEVALSLLPDGFSLYYEREADLFLLRAQVGDVRNSGLQAVLGAGMAFETTLNLKVPWTTREAYYQDQYALDTDPLDDLAQHVQSTATFPLIVGPHVLGVLAVGLFDHRVWSPTDRVVLEVIVRQLGLVLEAAQERTQLDDEQAAQLIFSAFTELAASETDVQVLCEKAFAVMNAYFTDFHSAYLEVQNELWKPVATVHLRPGQLAVVRAGLPLTVPSFAQALETRQPVFIDGWDEEREGVPNSDMFGPVCLFPLVVNGEVRGLFTVGFWLGGQWRERDRAMIQALGQSLTAALQRTEQTRQLTVQRDRLDTQTRQLQAANADIEAFSYSVSHDLRTPVRHMLGFLKLARTSLEGRLDERSARYLDVVGQAGEQMNTLIDALLNVSRAARQDLKPQEVDLNRVIKQIQESLLPDLEARDVRWEVASMPPVWGDMAALKQVLTQLTENALKFTCTRDPAIIRVWAGDQGDAWKVFVQDNGLGFDPRYGDRLFNLFQRLHTAQEASGTGVGLAQVKRLILKHGGQVFAEGQPGEGATFGFTLPKETASA